MKLIYNPAAGRGRARRHIAEAQAYFSARGVKVECEASETPQHLTSLAAQASRADYDRVVICGGDGSLHLAVREFDLERGTLALLPLGSGDDFARVCEIPRMLPAACEVALRGRVREVDVALANNIRYLGVAGLGFDSEVARYANEEVKLLRGSLVYLYAILRVLPRFEARDVKLDGKDLSIMFATVGNSRQYGAGIRIVPDAKIDDGLLDLCIVHRATRMQLLRTLPLAYSGRHVKKSFVEIGRGKAFRFESKHDLIVYADGERITTTPVSFGLEERKLKLVVPAPVSSRA